MAALEIQKRVKNATLYTNGSIRIDNVRVSFPHLAEPYAGNDDNGKAGEPKYGIVGMLPKETHVEAKDLVKAAIDKLLADADNAKVAADKKFLRNGDDQDREEYEGHWTVSAREGRRPAVRDAKGNLLDANQDKEQIEEMIFGGCICHILIRPWYQDGQKTGKGFGKRVNAGLVAVVFCKDDGVSFGEGRIDDADAWDDLPAAGGGSAAAKIDDDDEL